MGGSPGNMRERDHMQANLCQHRKTDGAPCQAAAYRNGNYCRHHARYYDLTDVPAGRPDYLPAVPDHPDAALLTVHQATRAFLAGKIDAGTCRTIIYAAQVASSILGQRLAYERLALDRARELERQREEEGRSQRRTEAFLEALRQHQKETGRPKQIIVAPPVK
jgi:hypothetical protein